MKTLIADYQVGAEYSGASEGRVVCKKDKCGKIQSGMNKQESEVGRAVKRLP